MGELRKRDIPNGKSRLIVLAKENGIFIFFYKCLWHSSSFGASLGGVKKALGQINNCQWMPGKFGSGWGMD
jgi:hypothetical protein